MTTGRVFAVSNELALLLARGYLRLLESRMQETSNPACCPRVEADRNRSNSLDVAAQQSVNWVDKDG
jgi:hypothetical protein